MGICQDVYRSLFHIRQPVVDLFHCRSRRLDQVADTVVVDGVPAVSKKYDSRRGNHQNDKYCIRDGQFRPRFLMFFVRLPSIALKEGRRRPQPPPCLSYILVIKFIYIGCIKNKSISQYAL